MSRVLITGGAGYIGSHTCKALARAGYEPVVLDNMIYGHEWAVKWGSLVKGDLTDRRILDDLFTEQRPSAVLHFAALTYVGESIEAPETYYRNNLAGSLNLLAAMKEHDCRKIVFSSSCAVYGEARTVPITEEHPRHPVNPYGWTKFMVEQMLRDFDRAYGIRHCALRYFNAAGADPEGEIGEDHDPETHLIPLLLRAATDPARPLRIFGTDYDTPDGTCIRDYVHVTDLAGAHVQALKFLEEGDASDSFNIGCGKGYSVKEILDAAGSITGHPIASVDAPRRTGDPAVLISDASKARDILQWRPALSSLEAILGTAWQWHTNHYGA